MTPRSLIANAVRDWIGIGLIVLIAGALFGLLVALP